MRLVESEETTLSLFAQNLRGIELIDISADWLVFFSPIVQEFLFERLVAYRFSIILSEFIFTCMAGELIVLILCEVASIDLRFHSNLWYHP